MEFVRPERRYKIITAEHEIEADDHIMTQYGIEAITKDPDGKHTFYLIIGGGDMVIDYHTERTLEDFAQAHEESKQMQAAANEQSEMQQQMYLELQKQAEAEMIQARKPTVTLDDGFA